MSRVFLPSELPDAAVQHHVLDVVDSWLPARPALIPTKSIHELRDIIEVEIGGADRDGLERVMAWVTEYLDAERKYRINAKRTETIRRRRRQQFEETLAAARAGRSTTWISPKVSRQLDEMLDRERQRRGLA